MSAESRLQSKIISYLKGKGYYVIKTGGIGTPDGCPDIIALCGGLWIAIEVKGSATSKYQPLQKDVLQLLDSWSWAKVAYPENWPEIKAELEIMI